MVKQVWAGIPSSWKKYWLISEKMMRSLLYVSCWLKFDLLFHLVFSLFWGVMQGCQLGKRSFMAASELVSAVSSIFCDTITLLSRVADDPFVHLISHTHTKTLNIIH